MRHAGLIISLLTVFTLVSSCSKKSENVKFEKESEIYQLAKDMSTMVPYLDPDDNNVIVKTKDFDITTAEIFKNLEANMGNRVYQMRQLDTLKIKDTVKKNAKEIAEKKLLFKKAFRNGLIVTDAEVDSIMGLHYGQAGGEENFVQQLKNNEISFEHVKNDIREGLLIQKYLNEKFLEVATVSESEIEENYDRDKTATVRHVLLMTQGKSEEEKKEIYKKMQSILEEARSGADFSELAKKYSEDPGSKDKGGLYENFARGKMVKSFEDSAFSVPVGEISDIVETRYGYHIIKVIDRQKETKSYDEVREAIGKQLEWNKRRDVYYGMLDDLRNEANFEEIDF
jgi:parvulin-like peptidyl-prolyl isomerase